MGSARSAGCVSRIGRGRVGGSAGVTDQVVGEQVHQQAVVPARRPRRARIGACTPTGRNPPSRNPGWRRVVRGRVDGEAGGGPTRRPGVGPGCGPRPRRRPRRAPPGRGRRPCWRAGSPGPSSAYHWIAPITRPSARSRRQCRSPPRSTRRARSTRSSPPRQRTGVPPGRPGSRRGPARPRPSAGRRVTARPLVQPIGSDPGSPCSTQIADQPAGTHLHLHPAAARAEPRRLQLPGRRARRSGRPRSPAHRTGRTTPRRHVVTAWPRAP